MSFMRMENNVGLLTAPCGTPEWSGYMGEELEDIVTLILRHLRNCCRYCASLPEMPILWSLVSRPWCHTVSKAWLMSRSTHTQYCFVRRAVRAWCSSRVIASIVL